MATLTSSQVDRLGERLRRNPTSADDRRLLDEYRRSFRPAYDTMMATVAALGLKASGRSAKSVTAIVAKLQRETTRLSRMQDIAGCRIVVANLAAQDDAVAALRTRFSEAMVVDRREQPRHGYRAVHMIPRIAGRQVEVQIRTELQDRWAELSERLADAFGAELKYGGGRDDLNSMLARTSHDIAAIEKIEWEVASMAIPPELKESTLALWVTMRRAVAEATEEAIARLAERKSRSRRLS